MAISQKLPPPQGSTGSAQTEWSNGGADSAISNSVSSSLEEEISSTPMDEDNGIESSENARNLVIMHKPRPSPRVSPTCRRRISAARCANAAESESESESESVARLRHHLASLKSLLPPSARSLKAGNVVADALRYKRALKKEIQALEKALPYAQQVHVKRLGSGGLQIGVCCSKEPGLLVALMEAIESFGLVFTNMNVSCLNGKIRINAISDMVIEESIGSLRIALMATIMGFNAH